MKKKLVTVMLAGVLAAGMSAGSVQAATADDASGDLYVFIAASLNNAMEVIQKDFNEEYPDVNILFNADSSGTLQTQIEEGSRCDIFFSAAQKQMDQLESDGLVVDGTRANVVNNQVVVVSRKLLPLIPIHQTLAVVGECGLPCFCAVSDECCVYFLLTCVV